VYLFLFDYKTTGPDYLKTIGVDEARVLENLAFLYRSGARITLRCPMVPGVNDSPLFLEAIARLDRAYPNLLGVEILPYQNTYTSKFERYGYTNPLPNLPAAGESDRRRWMEALTKAGSRKARIES
jgi:pyruvate formate lyase activating enzyme